MIARIIPYAFLIVIVLGIGCTPNTNEGELVTSQPVIQTATSLPTYTPTFETFSTPLSTDIQEQQVMSTTPTVTPVTNSSDNSTSTPQAPTAIPTPTPTPKLLLSFRLHANSESLFEGPIVAIDAQNHETGEYGIVLLDLTNGINRQLWIQPPAEFILGFDWDNTGCQLNIIWRTASDLAGATVDLNGTITNQYAINYPDEDKEKTITDWMPSPSGEWLTYLVHSGERSMFYSEIQDVRLLSLDDNDLSSLLLSEGALNYEVKWSSNGQFLAFTNIEERGSPQVFVYDALNKTSLQLTDFSTGIENVAASYWSPNDEYVIVIVTTGEGLSEIWSVSTDRVNQSRAEIESPSNARILGWVDNDTYAVIAEQESLETSPSISAILWIDTMTGEVINSFSLDEENILHGRNFLTGNDTVTVLRDGEVMRFSMLSGIAETVGESPFQSPVDVLLPAPSYRLGPTSFLGEEHCE